MEEENIFRMSANFFPLFFYSRNKDSNIHTSKKTRPVFGNYFSRKFSSLETIFSHFLPIQVEGEDQKCQNIRNDSLKTSNKPNASQILQWNQDLSHVESDFSPFFHFLQKLLSMESSNSRTNPTDQSCSKVHPGIFFLPQDPTTGGGGSNLLPAAFFICIPFPFGG